MQLFIINLMKSNQKTQYWFSLFQYIQLLWTEQVKQMTVWHGRPALLLLLKIAGQVI